MLRPAVESIAQQLAQARDHPSHATRVALDQRRNRVQRVEQKMGIELRVEGRQLRFSELRLELRGFCLQNCRLVFARAKPQEVIASESSSEHPPKKNEVIEDHRTAQHAEWIAERSRTAAAARPQY